MMITSPNNQWLKRARALLSRRGREREGAFLVEGPRALRTVLEAGAQIECVLLEVTAVEAPELRAALAAARVQVEAATPGLLGTVFETETPQGWLAVVRSPETSGPPAARPARLVLADRVQDPGNLGSLLRTADAVGAAVVLLGGTADPLTPKVVRASAGSVVRVPWWRQPAAEVRAWLAETGGGVVVLDSGAGDDLLTADLPWPLALVAGSEAHGPSEVWADAPRLRLPMRAGAESLNVAIATAVALYDSVRKHGIGDDGA